MTAGSRGSIASAGSFWRPREREHSWSVASVYAVPVASVYALTYPGSAASCVSLTSAPGVEAEIAPTQKIPSAAAPAAKNTLLMDPPPSSADFALDAIGGRE